MERTWETGEAGSRLLLGVGGISPQLISLPKYSRLDALVFEDQENEENDEVDKGSSRLEESPRKGQRVALYCDQLYREKRRVAVISDSILRGTESPIYLPDLTHRGVCLPPWGQGEGCS